MLLHLGQHFLQKTECESLLFLVATTKVTCYLLHKEKPSQLVLVNEQHKTYRSILVSPPSCGGEINNWKTRINSCNDEIPHRLYSN